MFLPDSVLEDWTIVRICPFLLGCPFYWTFYYPFYLMRLEVYQFCLSFQRSSFYFYWSFLLFYYFCLIFMVYFLLWLWALCVLPSLVALSVRWHCVFEISFFFLYLSSKGFLFTYFFRFKFYFPNTFFFSYCTAWWPS